MKKMYKRSLLLFVLSIILLIGCSQADNEEASESSTVQEVEGAIKAENEEAFMEIGFEGQDIEGNTVSNAVFSESKLTMVNVWATYCNPCLSEMPGLGELANEYASEDFQIIGIISDVQTGAASETIAYAADLIEQTGADYTHLLLNKSLYDALLTDVTAVPTTYFIDANGTILDTVVGSMEKSAWEEKINALLEEL